VYVRVCVCVCVDLISYPLGSFVYFIFCKLSLLCHGQSVLLTEFPTVLPICCICLDQLSDTSNWRWQNA